MQINWLHCTVCHTQPNQLASLYCVSHPPIHPCAPTSLYTSLYFTFNLRNQPPLTCVINTPTPHPCYKYPPPSPPPPSMAACHTPTVLNLHTPTPPPTDTYPPVWYICCWIPVLGSMTVISFC